MKQNKSCPYFAKYKAVYPPKCRCEACWSKYFETNPGKFAAICHGVDRYGVSMVTTVMGNKYMKFFLRYRSTLETILKQPAKTV